MHDRHAVAGSDGSGELLFELPDAGAGGQPPGTQDGRDLIDFAVSDGWPEEGDGLDCHKALVN